MAIRIASLLHRNRYGVLYFRMGVPADLQQHFHSKEIYRSLRTASISQATTEAQTLSIALRQAFAEIRQQTMHDTKDQPDGPADRLTLQQIVDRAKERIHFRSLIEEREAEADDMRILYLQAKKHNKNALEEEKKRSDETLKVAVKAATFVPSVPTSDELASGYIDAYLNIPHEVPLEAKTLEAYRAAIETFLKIVGNKPLGQMTIKDQNRFDDVIVKIPPNSTKIAATRNLSIDEVVSLGLKPMSVNNAKNIARRANSFLKWAFKREGFKCDIELLAELKIKKKKGMKAIKVRRAFNDDELSILFNHPAYGVSDQAGPYVYWLPLIGLHSGMRINEIAQLQLSDLVKKGGIDCFDVNDDPDVEEEPNLYEAASKRLKTEASRRLVPIHSRLIELGLLEYAQTLRQVGQRRLFPDLSDAGRDGPGQPASKQFARYCDKVGLTSKQLVFHSFRHGAVGRMRGALIEKDLRKSVIGHTEIEDAHDEYGDLDSDFSIVQKQRAIECLVFRGIDFDVLRGKVPKLIDLERGLKIQGKRETTKARKKGAA